MVSLGVSVDPERPFVQLFKNSDVQEVAETWPLNRCSRWKIQYTNKNVNHIRVMKISLGAKASIQKKCVLDVEAQIFRITLVKRKVYYRKTKVKSYSLIVQYLSLQYRDVWMKSQISCLALYTDGYVTKYPIC